MKDLSTPPVLDLESLIAPFPGEIPSGRNLAYEPEYDQIREARRAEEDLAQGDWRRDLKVANWPLVLEIGVRCLRERTKDLQIAAWLTEALVHLQGFAGLRDGFRLMFGIQSAFWESYYPQIDEGDLESRQGPFLFLNEPKLLPRLIRGIPLTAGDEHYNYHRYQESRDVENALRKSPGDEKTLLASGKIRAEQFDKEVAVTPRRFYERLVADLLGAREAFQAFDQDSDERFGQEAPSLLNVGKALDDCLRLLEPILAEKRISQPDSELDTPEPEPAPEPEPESVGELAEVGVGIDLESGSSAEAPLTVSTETPAPAQAPARSRSSNLDFGRILIEFQKRAQELAEAGQQLRENREQYASLQNQIRALDQQYEEIARRVSQDQEYQQLLAQLLQRP
ncbi:hypothetical protein BH23PLA1_BH23PLA1_24810 [soil metagenome]